MPSLGTVQIMARSSDGVGEPFKVRSAVSVNQDGVFSFTIPDELITTALQMAKQRLEFSVKLARVNHMIEGRDKAKVESFIKDIIRAYLTCEVTRETVICYRTDAKVAYWKKRDGTIVPSGGCDPEHREFNGWHGSLNANNHSSTYLVGVAARVYVKVTAHRSSGDEINYERYKEVDHHNPTANWAEKLNAFTGVGFGDYEIERLKQIPYTEEAAKFFHDTMLAMCVLAERISNFFGDEVKLQKHIEERSQFLLMSGDKT